MRILGVGDGGRACAACARLESLCCDTACCPRHGYRKARSAGGRHGYPLAMAQRSSGAPDQSDRIRGVCRSPIEWR
eukprot:2073757-Alexandrium_andersonii.AAC.1